MSTRPLAGREPASEPGYFSNSFLVPLIVSLAVLSALACGEDPEVPSDRELLAARPYRLVVPASLPADRPAPLLVVLHGYASSAAAIDSYYQFGLVAEREGFLYLLPEGSRDWAGNRAWNASPIHSPPWDVEYLRAVITEVKATKAVDANRIFVVGLSAGGHMAHRLACDLSPELAAVVSVAGQVPTDPKDCAPAGPVSVLQIHGDRDLVIGYHGDVRTPPDPSIPSARQIVAVWSRNDRCTGALADSGERLDLLPGIPGEETRVEATSGCPPGIAVELWTMEGGSHHPVVQPSWSDLVYGFLRAHPRP